MQEPYFIFDLDSTVTQEELLPLLARQIGMEEKSTEITEQARRGLLPFEESFRLQIELLRQIPVEDAQKIAGEIALNDRLVALIRAHRERCFLATENPDVWTQTLLQRLQMEGRCFSSKTIMRNGYIDRISYYLNKKEIVGHFPTPLVAVGDGASDAEMLHLASVGIGFGGSRPIAPAARDNADYCVFDEQQLCALLDHLACPQPIASAAAPSFLRP